MALGRFAASGVWESRLYSTRAIDRIEGQFFRECIDGTTFSKDDRTVQRVKTVNPEMGSLLGDFGTYPGHLHARRGEFVADCAILCVGANGFGVCSINTQCPRQAASKSSVERRF